MVQAVVAAEDNKFTKHFGFDFDAIKYAIEYNKTHKRKIGGSTITQQVAKMFFYFLIVHGFAKPLKHILRF